MSRSEDSTPPYHINPNKRLVLPMGVIVTVIGSVIAGTWVIRGYAEALRTDIAHQQMSIDRLSERVESLGSRAWLTDQQYRSEGQLRWEFRKSEFNIPDPRDFKAAP